MGSAYQEGEALNNAVISRKEIIDSSCEIIKKNGFGNFSIREAAADCNISVGSVYNYFSSKSELLCAAAESIWSEIFEHPDDSEIFFSIEKCLRWLCMRIDYGNREYPGFIENHSLLFSEAKGEEGRKAMEKMREHIIRSLTFVIKKDSKIRADAFNDKFTPEALAEVLFSLLFSSALGSSCNIDTILEIIHRTVY